MKELKLSSKYDNYLCDLANGEKLYSAEVTFHSSDLEYLKKLHEEYYHKHVSYGRVGSIEGSTCIVNILGFIYEMDPKPLESDPLISEFSDCRYHFKFTIIYVKEPSNYTIRGVHYGYYEYLASKNLVHHKLPFNKSLFKDEEKTNETWI